MQIEQLHIHDQITDLLPGFTDNSRVWIYAADRVFSAEEAEAIVDKGTAYAADWQAHKQLLKAGFKLFFNQFIVLVVDEQTHSASGCSIDNSVQFIKRLEQEYKVSLTNRMLYSFFNEDDAIVTAHLNDMHQHILDNHLSFVSPVFDNLVETKKEFNQRWIAPLKETWLFRFAES